MNSNEDELYTLLMEEACSIKFADDFELSEDEWPLEKSKTKLFIKPQENLKDNDLNHFRQAIDAIKDRFAAENIISKKFECSCVEYYYGNDCRTSRRICTNEMQCLNSGTCIDMIEFNREKNTFEFTYKCNCSEYYYGERCQYEVDLCQNMTCSSNGFCKVNATKAAVCNCFKFYSGENCQIRSKELVMIKQVISVSSIIAIVVISVMFLTLLLNDISSLFIKKEMKKNVQGCEEEEKEIANTKELKYTC
ncbi:protocadherin Fat 1 isoform X1 [Brachionus plicatilis]|uniref:Protocadherin Fat 1 isoform X1 n=1 Tax=Brachionus plicatilis TaxID=10195 RepID=A0A3M7R0S5_BRAPC|nr:protocadherin Fat 1 isoform X1 [Brachionus plicatilis]